MSLLPELLALCRRSGRVPRPVARVVAGCPAPAPLPSMGRQRIRPSSRRAGPLTRDGTAQPSARDRPVGRNPVRVSIPDRAFPSCQAICAADTGAGYSDFGRDARRRDAVGAGRRRAASRTRHAAAFGCSDPRDSHCRTAAHSDQHAATARLDCAARRPNRRFDPRHLSRNDRSHEPGGCPARAERDGTGLFR